MRNELPHILIREERDRLVEAKIAELRKDPQYRSLIKRTIAQNKAMKGKNPKGKRTGGPR